MKLYAVAFHGTGFAMPIDGKLEQCGFYKHEYVWAASEDEAKAHGRRKVSKRLASQTRSAVIKALHVVVDSVNVEPRIWRALSSPGFVFYKDEEKQTTSARASHATS